MDILSLFKLIQNS